MIARNLDHKLESHPWHKSWIESMRDLNQWLHQHKNNVYELRTRQEDTNRTKDTKTQSGTNDELD